MKKLTFLILAVLFLSSITLAYAAIPHLINYQGRITDKNGIPLDGAYNLTFRIYDAETAGTLLWEETHSGAVIQKGIFSVLLGSVVSLDNLVFDKQYWLEIKVNNEVMSPRQIIGSAAYAIAGVPSGVIVMWSGPISNIPKGWVLCDGTNGTPDLRDRFVVGARQDEGGIAKTNITGSLTQSGDGQIPSHTHGAGSLVTNTSGAHTHSTNIATNTGDGSGQALYQMQPWETIYTDSQGDHSHALSGSTAATGSGAKVVATYYALCFIMKL